MIGAALAMRERDVPPEPRAEPPGEEQGVGARALHGQPLHGGSPASAPRARPPAAARAARRDRRPRPARRAGRGSRTARGSRATPRSRRRAGRRRRRGRRAPARASPAARASGRTPAGPRSGGAARSRPGGGRHRRSAGARSPPRGPRARRRSRSLDGGARVDSVRRPGTGTSRIVLRGVALGEAREDASHAGEPTGRCPDDVRHRARAEVRLAVRLLAAPRPRQLPLDLRDDAHGCLVPPPGAAVAMEQLVGLAGPHDCRPRSWGTSGGRGSRRRRSRPRASTAPRPRPRA